MRKEAGLVLSSCDKHGCKMLEEIVELFRRIVYPEAGRVFLSPRSMRHFLYEFGIEVVDNFQFTFHLPEYHLKSVRNARDGKFR